MGAASLLASRDVPASRPVFDEPPLEVGAPPEDAPPPEFDAPLDVIPPLADEAPPVAMDDVPLSFALVNDVLLHATSNEVSAAPQMK